MPLNREYSPDNTQTSSHNQTENHSLNQEKMVVHSKYVIGIFFILIENLQKESV